MAGGRGRVAAGEYARRVNAAAEQLESGLPVTEAARLLAQRFGCSVRQARRYVERAGQVGRTVAPEVTTVFTVRLPARLVARVRERGLEPRAVLVRRSTLEDVFLRLTGRTLVD